MRSGERLLLCVILFLLSFSCYSQSSIRIQGVVSSQTDGKPIANAMLQSNGLIIGYSGVDGRFSIVTERGTRLTIAHENYNDVEIEVTGQQQLNIKMEGQNIRMDAVVLVASGSSNRVFVEPSEIELRGNYFHLKTKFRLPDQLFKRDHRFLIQPTIYNISKQHYTLLHPVVIDGAAYSMTQYRHLGFDDSKDLLAEYIIEQSDQGDIYDYKDSVYVASSDVDDDYRSECYLALAGYHPPFKYQDTVVIAKGVRSDLRFLEYKLKPLELDDPKYIPAPQLSLRNDSGSTTIAYAVDSVNIDLSNKTNKENVGVITSLIERIQHDENSTLQSLSIVGYASPDGSIKNNSEIAERRTQSLLELLSQSIDNQTDIELTSRSVISRWSELIDIVSVDDQHLASKIEQIVTKHGDDYVNTQRAIKRLKEYKSIIAPRYLPRLRRVEYKIKYIFFREPTVEEIREKYVADRLSLSAYEYYKLIKAEEVVQVEQDAITAYPKFIWVLNRMAARGIVNDSANVDILQPILDNAPLAVRYNQAVAAILNNDISLADSIAATLKGIESSEVCYLNSVIAIYNGDYMSGFAALAPPNSFNEVVLLLAMGQNKRAYDKITTLMQMADNHNNAKGWYLFAIAANRADNLSSAMVYLQHAIELDPTIENIAAIDSDIQEVYGLIQIE